MSENTEPIEEQEQEPDRTGKVPCIRCQGDGRCGCCRGACEYCGGDGWIDK